MVKLGEHFASDDPGRHSEWLRQQQWFIKACQDNQHRDTVEDKAEQNASAFASAIVMATATQIEEFHAKLDTYDEATIRALMETQELIDASEARIEDLLARAYVMDDANLYAMRNVVERFFCRMKGMRRLATRFEKLSQNFLAMLHLFAIRQWCN